MDPGSLAIIAKALEPFFGLLAVASIPTGILWVIKHHKVRMKELEIEAARLPRNAEVRLDAIEGRLSAIEQALLSGPARSLIEERAALLEAPAKESEPRALAPPTRTGER
jgi:hypothetical protein